jgi:glycosyltransferase involved in cell wall biosynthesis
VTISVLVSTYRRPEFLDLVLHGYAAQTDRAFEVVTADDGSGDETRRVIERAAADHGLDIVHVWHEDRGFRKTEILNRAIVAASGSYLLFTDGDCIPRSDLVATHRALARDGRYVAGGYLKLPPTVSERVDREVVSSGKVADLGWLRAAGWRPGRRALRLTRSSTVGALFDRLTPTAADFHGNNASVAREALTAVNGFEGEMGYGGLDKALGYRLQNLGIRGIQARHRAVALHLHHDRPYRDREVVDRNRAILARIRRGREVRARRGIAELEPDPSLSVEYHGRGSEDEQR